MDGLVDLVEDIGSGTVRFWERRNNLYAFTTKRQIMDWYSRYMPGDELTEVIREIESKPFFKRDSEEELSTLQRLRRLDKGISEYLKKKE